MHPYITLWHAFVAKKNNIFHSVTVNVDIWHWPTTLTFELYLDRIKTNQCAKYLGQRSFISKVIVRTRRQTHTHDRLLYLDHWSGWSVMLITGPTVYRDSTGKFMAVFSRTLLVVHYLELLWRRVERALTLHTALTRRAVQSFSMTECTGARGVILSQKEEASSNTGTWE